MTTYVAGHTFDSCDMCTCGRRWIDIMHVDESYVDNVGYAHTGGISRSEITQIQNEKQRRDAVYMTALKDACAG